MVQLEKMPDSSFDLVVTLRKRLIETILWSGIGASILYVSALYATGHFATLFHFFYSLSTVPLFFCLLILLWRGQDRLVIILFVVITWGIMTVGALLAGGVSSPGYSGLLLPIIFTGLLLGKREGVFIALLSALVGSVFVIANYQGWFESTVQNTDLSIWVSHLLFFVVASALIYISSNNSEKIYAQLKYNEQAVHEANAKLLTEIETRIAAEKDLKLQADTLAHRTELLQLVTLLATQFINLSTDEMDEELTEALELLCAFFEVQRGVIALFSEDSQTINVRYEYRDPCHPIESDLPSEFKLSMFPWCMGCINSFRPVTLSSLNELPPSASVDRATFEAVGLKSIIAIPLIQDQQVIGFTGFSSFCCSVEWSPEMLSHLSIFSHLIVNLLDRQKSEQELKQRDADTQFLTEQLSVLLETERAIFSAQSLKEASQKALEHLLHLCNCEYTSVFFVNPDAKTGSYFAQSPPFHLPSPNIPLSSVPLTSIISLDELREGQIQLDDTVAVGGGSSAEQQIAAALSLHAICRIPLRTSEEFIGILYLGFADPLAFGELDLALVEGIVISLSTAIANKRLYERVQLQAEILEHKVIESTVELTRQYNQQAALAQIELAINEPSELQNLLEKIVSVTTEAIEADKGVSIVLWDAEKEMYTVSATTVPGQRHNQTARRLRKREGATRWILEHGQPLIVPDTDKDPFGANRMISEFNIGAYIGVPLLTDKGVVGVLYTLMGQPQSIGADKIEFLTMVGRRAALAITKVRLFGQAQEVAAERERQRLARELHDVVSQSLFSANLIAESLPLLLERNPERAHKELKDLHLLTRAATDEMRSLLIELRPRQLINKEFGELVHQLVSAFSSRTRIPVALQIGCEMQFPPEVQISLYRIVQETLNNIAKHAKANKAWLKLSFETNMVLLDIRDDGRGFDQSLVGAKHMGLNIMQERADEIGAKLCINSAPNSGTAITVHYRIHEDRQLHDRYEVDPNFARG